ncbi:MAG: AAA family ATPase [Betaproteobacteria bacterium]
MNTSIKYAPTNLGEVIYPSSAVERRIQAYASGQLNGHILLHGPNGTGKTTVANLLVNAIGGINARVGPRDFEEFLVRPKLREFMLNASAWAGLTLGDKYFLVFNEFDYAKRGLHKFWSALDECGDAVMTIITTNNPMNIGRALRSRFDMIEFSGVTAGAALPRIQQVLRAEKLVLPDAQVLYYLQQVEHFMDARKYFKKADELLFLRDNAIAFPAWTATAPTLKIV